MQRIFFVGDIHGCSKTFRRLVTEKICLKKEDKLYCVGDYIDRGPDSKGVIDFILELKTENYQIYTLRGNHEEMLLDSADEDGSFHNWIRNGGDKTLKSFKVKSIVELKPVYLDFFKQTQYFIETKKFIFVHAGLDFSIDDPLADTESMLWIRDFPVDENYLNGKLLIHGHTPQTRDYILSQKFESPFNLDGGCVFKNVEGLGHLFALNFTEEKLIDTVNID